MHVLSMNVCVSELVSLACFAFGCVWVQILTALLYWCFEMVLRTSASMDVWANVMLYSCCVTYNYGDYSHHFGVEVLRPLPPLGGVVLPVCIFCWLLCSFVLLNMFQV